MKTSEMSSRPLSIEALGVLTVKTPNKLLRNTLFGYKSKERKFVPSVMYFIRGVTRELHILPRLFQKAYQNVDIRYFKKQWLKSDDEGEYYDFCGAKVSYEKALEFSVRYYFNDTFYFHCLFQDRYDSRLVRKLDPYLNEGPYSYEGDGIDVRVKSGDVVIDAGASVGDFSAYAAVKGAVAYAFEPTSNAYRILCRTACLNRTERIIPVKKALGKELGEGTILLNNNDKGNTVLIDGNRTQNGTGTEQIEMTTVDDFVREKGLTHVDFIKSDIEGFERYMLMGAKETLKRFAPKLAICTYHLPDDPQVLAEIIKEANPDYRIVQMRHKLFAAVV